MCPNKGSQEYLGPKVVHTCQIESGLSWEWKPLQQCSTISGILYMQNMQENSINPQRDLI